MVISIFRSRLRLENADEFQTLAARMMKLESRFARGVGAAAGPGGAKAS